MSDEESGKFETQTEAMLDAIEEAMSEGGAWLGAVRSSRREVSKARAGV